MCINNARDRPLVYKNVYMILIKLYLHHLVNALLLVQRSRKIERQKKPEALFKTFMDTLIAGIAFCTFASIIRNQQTGGGGTKWTNVYGNTETKEYANDKPGDQLTS